MKFYHTISGFPLLPNAVVTIGVFDGVHHGHRTIIDRMKTIAMETGGETVLVTFNPHPRTVLYEDSKFLKFIHSRSRKADLLARTGIDYLIEIPFTMEFAQMPAKTFIENILVKQIGVKHLVVGHDYHFGKGKEGTYEGLVAMGQEMGFSVERIAPVKIGGIVVSSTQIRKALREGNITKANALLGYEYSILGEVIYGQQLGRTIGFPTANIEVPNKLKLLAANGVYACKILWKNEKHIGMGNIGYRPTVNGDNLTIEVNIFDFNTDIYGDFLTLYFVERIRDEIKFKNLQALKEQLIRDEIIVRERLKISKQ
ncbi:MAG: bifunctional riboflavin kinase/FAD synthetase [Bacteroidia bacterium]|nr:bifunctional riboflavin kinase/FAD synthetase [Bacteroidia bacterium]